MDIENYRKEELREIEGKISYHFTDLNLLNISLTHSSYSNENENFSDNNNERLEFLGDAVLNLVVSEYLFKKFKDLPEGELTKKRATVVCEKSLAYGARKLDIGKYLLLGKGEIATGGRTRESILADAFEALVGAVYLDGGMSAAKEFLIGVFELEVKKAFYKGDLFIDYKTELQESLQKKTKSSIRYKVEKEVGPDHDKKFYMNVIIDSKVIGRGIGRNKKEAEQMAAKQALKKIGEIYES